MDYVALVIVVVVFVGLAFAVRPRPRLIIRIQTDMHPEVRGPVPLELVELIRELCQEMGIAKGEIRGFERSRRIDLDFSRSIPSAFRQRVRNVWANRRS
jgi:hypothetical protein